MNLNMAKAYFILLVIIDHNNLSRYFIGDFLEGLTFHVVGFFSLYYMNEYDKKQCYTDLILKQVVRYIYPYALFVISLSVVIYFQKAPDLSSHIAVTLKALYSGNYIFLKQSTNMYLLWFLPAFVSFVFLDKLYKGYAEKYNKPMFLGLFCLFISIPFLPESIDKIMPMGLLAACYILFLTVVIKFLYITYISTLEIKVRVFVVLLAFIIIKLIQIELNLSQEIGFLKVAVITDVPAFVINTLESVVGVLLVYAVSSIPLYGFLNAMGKYSLQVYLFHAFIAVFISKILDLSFNEYNFITWLVSILLTAGFSTVLSMNIMKNKVFLRYLFPKDFNVLIFGNK